ncbi:MAG: ribosome assembly RNA-binding protein YhbY [Bdellovibrionota bacterium]
MELTAKQKKHLKKLAHPLPALVQIGKGGISPQVVKEIDRILNEHELIKVKISALDKEDFQSLTAELVEKSDANFIHSIGRTVILYRQASDSDKHRIKII